MSHRTAIQIADKRFIFLTQQYQVGLYVAVYSADENWKTFGRPNQIGVKGEEIAYHEKLRKKAVAQKQLVPEYCSTL